MRSSLRGKDECVKRERKNKAGGFEENQLKVNKAKYNILDRGLGTRGAERVTQKDQKVGRRPRDFPWKQLAKPPSERTQNDSRKTEEGGT